MQAQRQTWLRDLPYEVDYRYFLGQPSRHDADVVYLPSADGPNWNGPYRTRVGNRKTEAIVRYALDNGYNYVFKCDDDTYVRVELLLKSGFEKHDYSGITASHYAFNGIGHYRWSQGGAGYWLSRRAMEIIAEHGLHLVPAEDFAVGQLLAKYGIHPSHDERYRPAVTQAEIDKPDPAWITLHKINPAQMRRLHQSL